MATIPSITFAPRTVSVIGLGHIGLPTAAMFASRGVKVIGVDINQETVDVINQGKTHFLEPRLDRLVQLGVSNGCLRATTIPEPSDAFLIAVPTPLTTDNQPNLDFVRASVESIAPVLASANVVILESTSPVGTTERLRDWLVAARPDLRFPAFGNNVADICIAYCPERVLPGQAIRELEYNDRVIGGLTTICSQRASQIYRIFAKGNLHFTTSRLAEMTKLAENSFRDVNIAYANELSLICDTLRLDVRELIELANRHPRVNILQPGCGVGGHCIAIDPWFIADGAPDETQLIQTARKVNDSKPDWVVDKIKQEIQSIVADGRNEADIVIALLGLAFKPDIADLRGSPALQIANTLQECTKAKIVAVEPNIASPRQLLEGIQMCDFETALSKANIIALLVAHTQFSSLRTRLRNRQSLVDVAGETFGRIESQK